MSILEKMIEQLQHRRQQDLPAETAEFIVAYIRLLAEGKPVSAQRLANELGDPVEFIVTAFQQMQQIGTEFNEQGELIGAALTLSPTRHQFVVDGQTLYAWCGLDTLFLAAYVGKTATVTSTCPQTEATITLTITPDGIETFTPTETVLSIVTATSCTAGIEGSFCNQVHFFASHNAAKTWIGARPDFAILTLAEAYQLAQQIYIDPVMKHIK